MSGYAIVGEWLVEETGECTCGTGGMDGHGHERGCGQEPIYKVDELLANYRAQSARAERAEAQVRAVEALTAEWYAEKGAADGYAVTAEGRSFASASRLCADEVRAALAEPTP